ncbi:MAG: zinc-binding dehydrogenase [Verrucomicrobiota bacterium]|nr:zinc-binding dehydrogenase [Verrucomicrobiota bacterium]
MPTSAEAPVAKSSAGRAGSMRAAVVAEPGRIEIAEVEIPQPKANQLLVRLEGCGVCASNIPPWEGKPWFNYPMMPGALGHEGWGKVEAVGEDVTDFAAGDRVAMISNNAYAEYDLCDPAATVKLPESLGDEPFPAEPLGCAMNIFKRAQFEKFGTVAIVGIGFLGALLTQLASGIGARAIAISRRPFALEFARHMGAAHTIEMNDHARIIEEVKQLTGLAFCEVVIEAVGKQWPLDLSAELTRERGRLVIAGYHQDGPRQINMQLWNWRGLDVINAHERDPAIYLEGMQAAVSAVESKLLNPRSLYTHRFDLEELGDALNMSAQRPDGFMKALISMA